MRLDEWQRWLDSQFLEPEEPAETVFEAAVEPECLPDHEAPTTYVAQNGHVEEPQNPTYFVPGHTHNGAAAPVDVGSHAQSYAPAAAEPPAPVSTQPVAVPETRYEPQPGVTADQSRAADDIGVPSIEQYLPFLRNRQEAPAVPPVGEPSPEPAAQAPVSAKSEAQSIAAETPQPVVEAEAAPATVVEQEPPAHARPMSLRTHRSRNGRPGRSEQGAGSLSAQEVWSLTPRSLQTLIAMTDDEVAQHSYKRGFKESRIELLQRLLDPTLSLEETARLLNVCPTTVRRYTNRGMLRHLRTGGDQRRFKLSDVLSFLESQSTTSPPPER
jgi:excisionase family DNA binding protein